MGTGKRRISLADVVRVAPVVRAALVVPEDPVELAVRVALAVPEDPVELAVRAALVVPEDPAVPVALVVSESPAVPVALVVLVAAELELDPAVVELERVPVVVELERDQAAAPVQDHRPAQLAVALRTKSVIAAHHPDQVPLLAVEEDLAAAAETTREPAAAEAAKAWAAAE
jgi:hypothetical protein